MELYSSVNLVCCLIIQNIYYYGIIILVTSTMLYIAQYVATHGVHCTYIHALRMYSASKNVMYGFARLHTPVCDLILKNPTKLSHSVFREIPILSTQATMVLSC